MDIVFVHLNTSVPKYLQFNLETTISRFPEHRVILLHNKSVKVPKISNLLSYEVAEDSRWRRLSDLYDHPKDFRGNFWLTSSARLFAIEAYLQKENSEVLHVESDVILSPDFPFSNFRKIEKRLAFPLISDSRGVASIVYVRDKFAAAILTSTLISEAEKNPQTTEMLSLRVVYERNFDKVQILPIGPEGVRSYRNIESVMVSKFSEGLRIFNGVFDGVEIGQFFTGTDPRNRRGKILLRHDLVDGYLNVNELEVLFDSDRQFINIRTKKNFNSCSPIFALHVPVKQTRFFKKTSQARKLNRIARESRRRKTIKLSFPVLIKSALLSFNRRVKKLSGSTT